MFIQSYKYAILIVDVLYTFPWVLYFYKKNCLNVILYKIVLQKYSKNKEVII